MIASAQEEAIIVQWGPPELFERNGPIEGYEVVITFINGTNKIYPVQGNIFNVLIEGEKRLYIAENVHNNAPFSVPHVQAFPSSLT